MEESKLIEHVLEASFDAGSPNFVKAVLDQLKAAETPSFARADLIVEAKCGLLYSDQRKQIQYLHGCFQRADVMAKRDKVPAELKAKLPDLMRLLARFANLVLTIPEMFSDPDGNTNMTPTAGSAILTEFLVPGGMGGFSSGGATSSTSTGSPPVRLSLNFVHLLVQTIEQEMDPQDNPVECIRNLFQPALDAMMQGLKGRQFADHKLGELQYLTSLIQAKNPLVNRVICQYSKQFLPDAPQAVYGGGKALPKGFLLQMESLIGSLLCPTTMDTMLYKEKSCRKLHFEGCTKKAHRIIRASQETQRGGMQQVMEQILAIVNPLLRSGEECREAVVTWLAQMLVGNEARAKGSNQIHEGGDVSHFLDTLENSPLPMQQNLDMRLSMQLQQAKMLGFSTPGCGNNVLWLLLELIRPVKLSAVGNILDPCVFAGSGAAAEEKSKKAASSSAGSGAVPSAPFPGTSTGEPQGASAALLGKFSEDTKMGDEESVKSARAKLNLDGEAATKQDFKFATKIFALLQKAFHCITVPTFKEDMCFLHGSSAMFNKAPEKADLCFGEHLCIETVLGCENFLSGMVHSMNLTCLFLLAAAYPECRGKIAQQSSEMRAVDAFHNVKVPPKEVSPEWAILPSVLLEDFVNILEYFRDVMPPGSVPGGGSQHPFFQRVDVDTLLLTLVFILGAGDHVKNPSIRGKVVNVIAYLIKTPRWSDRLQQFHPVADNMIPSCIQVFNAVEKTKQSYYDIRMQLKYQLRVPIMDLIALLIPRAEHKQNLREFARENNEDFLKFLNLLMSDATMQLDEGMDTLAAIRVRSQKTTPGGASSSSSAAGGGNGGADDENMQELMQTGAAGIGVDRGGIQEDERNEQGEDLYRRSRRDPKEHCRTYMKMGLRTIKTLYAITQETPEIITEKGVVLQQMVQNCLNASLNRLVGPKCMQLKSSKQDWESVSFKPVELLMMVCEMYVLIARAEKVKVISHVNNDGNVNVNAFQKAARIVKRDGMLRKELLTEFDEFVKDVGAASASNEAADLDDFPDEFGDTLMNELLVDPVTLPSGNKVNRATAERIYMSDAVDPFTRQAFTMADIEPDDELREKVHAWVRSRGIDPATLQL
ncbi:unnamed protein product [Amoebophrya sp. A25]|nr:unnamed protein product [Amoebophrya sp. A25]|eukprot:GSA25T00016899001.1